jgi:hypothetical protein
MARRRASAVSNHALAKLPNPRPSFEIYAFGVLLR